MDTHTHLLSAIRCCWITHRNISYSSRTVFYRFKIYKWNVGLPTIHITTTNAFASPHQHPQCGRNLWLDVQTYTSPDSENLYKSIALLYQSSLSPVVWNTIGTIMKEEKKKEIIIFTCGWIRSKKDCRNACSTWLDFMKCLMVSHL